MALETYYFSPNPVLIVLLTLHIRGQEDGEGGGWAGGSLSRSQGLSMVQMGHFIADLLQLATVCSRRLQDSSPVSGPPPRSPLPSMCQDVWTSILTGSFSGCSRRHHTKSLWSSPVVSSAPVSNVSSWGFMKDSFGGVIPGNCLQSLYGLTCSPHLFSF